MKPFAVKLIYQNSCNHLLHVTKTAEEEGKEASAQIYRTDKDIIKVLRNIFGLSKTDVFSIWVRLCSDSLHRVVQRLHFVDMAAPGRTLTQGWSLLSP